MPRPKPETDKQFALRQGGMLNPRPQDVRHPLFHGGDFFDPDDLVQVKYEMLRQGPCRQPADFSSCARFWVLPSLLLSGQCQFRRSGAGGFVALEARSKG